MCDPASIVIGVVSAGLGFMQQREAVRARNAEIEAQNLNMDAQFAVNLLQTKTNRFVQTQKEQTTDLTNATNEYLADRGAEKEFKIIDLDIARAQEQTAREKREKKLETWAASGEILAAKGGGINTAFLLADVENQYGNYDWVSDRNLAFTGAQKGFEKEGVLVRRAQRKAGLTPYIKQLYVDPAKPIHIPKRRFNTGMAAVSAGLQGASLGMQTHSTITGAGYQWKDGSYQKITSSTRLLKENIVKLGTSPEGHNIYKFNYINNSTNYIGVIAEEVQKIKPEAVLTMPNGFLGVDYDLIDVDFLVQAA